MDMTDMGMAPSATVTPASASNASLISPSMPSTVATDQSLSSVAQMCPSSPPMGMANSFHFGPGDALWTSTLTPTTGQGYAAAILVLILMAVVLRFLATVKTLAEKYWEAKKRKGNAVWGGPEPDEYIKIRESHEIAGEGGNASRWNASVLVPRALFQLFTMALGLLLMLAVMTFNLGYMLAILAGGFIGELAFGWVEG